MKTVTITCIDAPFGRSGHDAHAEVPDDWTPVLENVLEILENGGGLDTTTIKFPTMTYANEAIRVLTYQLHCHGHVYVYKVEMS